MWYLSSEKKKRRKDACYNKNAENSFYSITNKMTLRDGAFWILVSYHMLVPEVNGLHFHFFLRNLL